MEIEDENKLKEIYLSEYGEQILLNMFEFLKANNDYDGTRKKIIIKGFKLFYIFFRLLE